MKEYITHLFLGRVNKITFLFGIFIYIFYLGICWILSLLLFGVYQHTPAALVFTYIYITIGIIFFFSITIRRLHDVGLSGWDFINDFDVFKEGENRENEYGKPPKPTVDLKILFGF